jgi:RNA polymerase sigma factor (TIGR02999 family)
MEEASPHAASGCAADLIPAVYEKLRQLAKWKMSRESPQTLGATALVHEAWLRLSQPDDARQRRWEDERHFFATAAEAMRLILIDRARSRAAQKRGGDCVKEEGTMADIAATQPDEQVIAVGEALVKFAEVDPACAELVKLKYFVGMSWEEIASVSGESTRNLRRRWAYARSWLHAHLRREDG